MTYSGLKLTFVINNKTYDYPLFLISSPYNEPPFYWDSKAKWIENKSFIQYDSDIIPLFSFLELERKNYSVNATLNGNPITIEVENIDTNLEVGTYTARILQGSTVLLSVVEPITDDYLGSWGEFLGAAVGYNYATKNYIITRGGQYFSQTSVFTGKAIFKRGYGNKFKTNFITPPKSYLSLKPNTTYQASYYKSNHSWEVNYTIAILEVSSNLNNFMQDFDIPKYPDNPDDPENPDDDPTDPTPGTGDGTSDPIPVPPKPTTDVTGTGFVTLYNPSAIEIRQLAYFMWSGDFADLLKKILRAPFDCLIGLKLLYAPLSTGASQTIWLGNVETTVSASKITDQFIDFDCGELVIAEYFGSFLDYTPYTKISIFLPFIGYKQLNVDEVMNATIHLTYRIDVYSGACIAFLKVTKTITSTNLNSVLYSFDGNCAMDIPFTSGDMSRYVAAILGTAASTAGAVISNPMPSEAPLNTETDATKNPNEKHLSDLGNTSANLVAAKPQIQRGGSLAGANSSMGIKQPYIIIERPLQQMPYNYPNYIGIPLNMTKMLSQVTGFTVISDIFMASSQATDEEIKMITSKLKQGVVL